MLALLVLLGCYPDPPTNLAAEDPGACFFYVEEEHGYGADALGCHVSLNAYPDEPHCCPAGLDPVCINRDGGSVCSDPLWGEQDTGL
jgi:hypothetical protein